MKFLQQILQHVKQRPEEAALSQKVDGNWQHLSWQQVWKKVSHMAALMRRDGIQRGDRVAIFGNNSSEWVLADMACMYLGAVSVPVHSSSSTEQMRYVLDHSGSRFVFADPAQYERLLAVLEALPEIEKVVVFGEPWPELPLAEPFEEWLSGLAPIAPVAELSNDELMTIVYTSGTTGDPKGVMLSHGNLEAAMIAHQKGIDFAPGYRSISALPLSHVFERGWNYVVLYSGGHSFYVSDIKYLSSALLEVKPHAFCGVPRVFEKIHAGVFQKAEDAGKISHGILAWANARVLRNQRLQQAGKSLGWYRRAAQSLAQKLVGDKLRKALGGEIRLMPCGGASLDPDIHGFFMGMGLNVKIGYGMTETFASVSFMPDTGYQLGTLGQPMVGIEVRTHAENGEIQVKSPAMTSGYYRNQAETKALFTADGWLKTGDAGSIDRNGNLVFQERLKDLMKTSGGKYIAPQQIEGVLAREHLFEQVAVIADARKFVSALIVPAWGALEEYARSINIQYEDKMELLRHSSIVAFIEERLHEVQKELARFEQVKRFTLLPREFSVEDGEITPTLKLRRNVILQRFAHEIEAMYAGA